VIAAFREWFNKAPPRRATLLDWEKRASEVRIFWVYGDFSAILYIFDLSSLSSSYNKKYFRQKL